jgi:uracil-DNA glycosylase
MSDSDPAGGEAASRLLDLHVQQLLQCRLCPNMHKPVVSGGPVMSEVVLVGQAPGDKEPLLGRPFAWTAGKTLFKWFEESAGITEAQFRSGIYMAAVCRCFPGKKETGGDRVPTRDEIANCATWLTKEIELLKPKLVIAVGKLAIEQFLPNGRLDQVVGKLFSVRYGKASFDLLPLPHPSGASPWHRMEPGKTLLRQALQKFREHPASRSLIRRSQ